MKNQIELLFMEPVFKSMIWGGTRLRDEYGYHIPSETTGEGWTIAAHQNGNSVVRNGTYRGKSLGELWEENKEIFGECEEEVFPLLVKVIDAKQDLSVQVHPDDQYAQKNEKGALGKTECWYILDCEKDASIIIGHHASEREELEEWIAQGEWKQLLREIPISKGDFFQIKPGTIHAIKGGTLILEVQQNSDITYRVYDYDRTTNGVPRELHINKSIDVVTVPFGQEEIAATKEIQGEQEVSLKLVECQYYCVYKVRVDGRERFVWETSKFLLVSVVEGDGMISGTYIQKGDHFIVPAGCGELEIEGDVELICSHV